jgi:hypothetical protein
MAFERRAEPQEVVVRHRIDHGHTNALGPQRVDARADGRLALRHGLVVDQSDLAACLCLHHAHQIRICHRRERVVLHAGFVEQHLADEQVALEDGAPVVGEGGSGD